jgi:SAM-dependent methyltransferase
MPRIVPCLVCGHDGYRRVRVDCGAQVVRCQRCGFLYVNPQPTEQELVTLYAHDYYGEDPEGAADSLAYRMPVFQSGIRALRYLRDPGRLLDDGCGTGDFVALAQSAGWQAVGVELSLAAVSAAVKRGRDVRQGTLRDQRFPTACFDVITLWDVLEHLPDPKGEVKEIHRVLKPGGLLVVRVPNTTFQLAKAFCREHLAGKGPTALQANYHLSHFTSQSLKFLLEITGFSVVREEAGVADAKVHGSDVPLWIKRSYCALSRVASGLLFIQIGPTIVEYAQKRV